MLGIYAKKIIKGIIIRNIERGYIEVADEQLNSHISDFTENELEEIYGLLEAKINPNPDELPESEENS